MARTAEQIISEIDIENLDTVTDPELLGNLFTELLSTMGVRIWDFLEQDENESLRDQAAHFIGTRPRQD